ncbi:hypothetical protein OIO90_000337 [Microbotryomycetes sp. JL221]|nr:hypothetical protein OIO90_000337 [Microbotryomycetes sp. JL221]
MSTDAGAVPVTPSHNNIAPVLEGGLPDDLTKLPFPSVLYRPVATLVSSPASTTAAVAVSQALPPSPAMGMTSSEPPRGTEHDPVIPKRRRKTSADEVAILEAAFQRNPRPDLNERNELAARMNGMSARAVAVWMQNRRQKEKKDSSTRGSSVAPSSAGSADMDARSEVDGPRSSSPSSRTTEPASSSSALHEPVVRMALPSSDALYKMMPDNKENVHLHSTVQTSSLSAPRPISPPFVKSPTVATFNAAQMTDPQAATAQLPVYRTDVKKGAQQKPVAWAIAAKKHVRKRPLGSHAPLARKPSLSHAFNFPPSPPKLKSKTGSTSASVDTRPKVKRQGSSASLASLASGAARGSIFDLQSSASTSTQADTINRARSWVDALSIRAAEDDAEVQQQDVAAPAGSKSPLAEAATIEEMPTAPTSSSVRAAIPEPGPTPVTKRLRARDELLQHMASDLPSSPASPAPDKKTDEKPLRSGAIRLTARNPMRGVRLGFNNSAAASAAARVRRTTSGTMAAALEGSRAGGEEADALSVLERKRARLVGHDDASVLGSAGLTAPTRPKQARRTSSGSSSRARGNTTNNSKKQQLSSTAPTVTYSTASAMLFDAAAQELGRHRQASLTSAASASTGRATTLDQEDSDMGELSFSSTSTDNSALIGTPKQEHETRTSDFISDKRANEGHAMSATIKRAHQFSGVRTNGVDGGRGDDAERECAELLLGLGGGFC